MPIALAIPHPCEPPASSPSVPLISDLNRKKGLIVLASVTLAEAQAVQALAERLGWPLLCDPQSGVTSEWRHFDLWLQNSGARAALAQADTIIQFGAGLVSKRLLGFIKQQVTEHHCRYYVVSDQRRTINPDRLQQTRFRQGILAWLNQQTGAHCAENQSLQADWAAPLKAITQAVSTLVQAHKQLSELSLAAQLHAIVQQHDLFIGNSLMVRLVDMAGSVASNQVYSNRGASGIDGLVASAVGVQRINQRPLLLLLGDTSLLYDLNSLALCGETRQPLVVLVTNNDGGGIFDLLPVPEQQKQSLYRMPHGFDFKHAAAQFGLAYLQPTGLEQLISTANHHLNHGSGTLLIEVITPAGQASNEIKKLLSRVHALH
jgi:2-succinyl-5-enolpyruvyl-6-hydroxy-3-cyclohexene-1-carboxylate synthase